MESFAAPRPEATRIAALPRQVHTITDRFSMANTYIIEDQGIIVVDPGSELNVRLLQTYLHRFLHRSSADIDLIVLTHLHHDHMAGLHTLRRFCNAPTAASSAVRQMFKGKGGAMLPRIGQFAGQVLPGVLHHLDLFPPVYEQQIKIIDLWLEDVSGLAFHPDWRVIASPGHTPESLCLYNPFTLELLCGDTVITVEGGAPLVRSSAHRPQLEETLRVLRSLPVQYLYPGHGRPILANHPLSNASVEW